MAEGVRLDLLDTLENARLAGRNHAQLTDLQESNAKAWLAELSSLGTTPFVLEKKRWYTRKNWQLEQVVLDRLKQLIQEPNLDRPPPAPPESLNADQQIALSRCLTQRFTLLTGGPGTGKTFTAAHILAVFIKQKPDIQFAVAAPTGKAAMRLQTELSEQAALLETRPQVDTLHRLLQFDQFGRCQLKKQLDLDLLMVDEASMIDMALFHQLIMHLPNSCQIVLIGDKAQLHPVEVGAVFNDLCLSLKQSNSTLLCELNINQRFDAGSSIDLAAKNCLLGNWDSFKNTLTQSNIHWLNAEPSTLHLWPLLGAWRNYLELLKQHPHQGSDIVDLFQAFEQCRVLTPLRIGPMGSERLNDQIQQHLLGARQFVLGTPLVIRKNSYRQGLFNGDLGLVLPHPEDHQTLAGCFLSASEPVWIPLPQLPQCDLAWAQTIHKAQGSEFQTVILLWPEENGLAEMSQRLIYTAITRSKSTLHIIGNETALAKAIQQTHSSSTGLAAKLHS